MIPSAGALRTAVSAFYICVQPRVSCEWCQRLVFTMIELTGGKLHIAALVRMRQVSDKCPLRAQLKPWSQLPNLKRVIVPHGDIIAHDAAHVLGRMAMNLAA